MDLVFFFSARLRDFNTNARNHSLTRRQLTCSANKAFCPEFRFQFRAGKLAGKIGNRLTAGHAIRHRHTFAANELFIINFDYTQRS